MILRRLNSLEIDVLDTWVIFCEGKSCKRLSASRDNCSWKSEDSCSAT